MQLKHILLLSIFLFVGIGANSQNSKLLDSLWHQYESSKVDSTKMLLVGQLFKQSTSIAPTQSLRYAFLYDSLARKIGSPQEMARGVNFIGMGYYFQNSTEKAVEHYLKALELYKALKDTLYIGIVYNNIGSAQSAVLQHRNAIESYEKALIHFKQVSDLEWISNTSFNLGLAYTALQDLDKAIHHYEQAKELFQKLGNSASYIRTLLGMIDIYNQKGQHERAIEQHLNLIQVLPEEVNPQLSAVNFRGLAVNYMKLKNYRQAEIYAQKSLDIGVRHELLLTRKTALASLSEIKKLNGEFEKAYHYLREYVLVGDSLNNQQREQELTKLAETYKSKEKNQEIQLLKAENAKQESESRAKDAELLVRNQLLIFLILGISIILLALIPILYYYKLAQRVNKALASNLKEKEILLKEIHHRVKNNLQVISSLLGLQSRHVDDKKALEALQEGRDRVQSMAIIHKNLYQEGDLTGVNVQEYILKLIQSLFSSYNIDAQRITLKTEIEPIKIDVDTAIPLGLILNELISNALKYAFPDGKEGQLYIHLKQEGAQLLLKVSDNGVGLEAETQLTNSKSLGFQLISAFSDKLKASFSIENQQGLTVNLSIPNSGL